MAVAEEGFEVKKQLKLSKREEEHVAHGRLIEVRDLVRKYKYIKTPAFKIPGGFTCGPFGTDNALELAKEIMKIINGR